MKLKNVVRGQQGTNLHHDQAGRRPTRPRRRNHQAIRAKGIQARRHEVYVGELTLGGWGGGGVTQLID